MVHIKSVFVHIDTYTQTYVHVQIYEGDSKVLIVKSG